MNGVSRYTYSYNTMVCDVSLDVGKYENVPHSNNGIRKLFSENNIEWYSTVGLLTFIFGVYCTVNPDSLSNKRGSRLLFIEGTYRAFFHRRVSNNGHQHTQSVPIWSYSRV